ncbi:hypothetical protein HCN44_003372 [Aphidius gifuensis]|uniref:IF140/IFT172/WDR19 TPR domain-containing protein n=1 Tax=Aphidius gifuensis TaxID=684658 RepID=A0A834XZ23_APHGI|nr:hypothetical protein HCN44_003372 [Aphidius gifuensis]
MSYRGRGNQQPRSHQSMVFFHKCKKPPLYVKKEEPQDEHEEEVTCINPEAINPWLPFKQAPPLYVKKEEPQDEHVEEVTCINPEAINPWLPFKQAPPLYVKKEEPQDEHVEETINAKISILADKLELYNDAERLFHEANRLDLLSYLYESSNKYTDAITLAKNENKIPKKLSYFNYAKALESNRDIDKAIEMYTKADCHRFEVPRILLNRLQELYSDDPAIKKWHAQYVESKGDMEGALRLYEAANDTLGVTRILCYLDRREEVNKLVMKTNHAVSAYHLASHYDSLNDPQQAVHFYTITEA